MVVSNRLGSCFEGIRGTKGSLQLRDGVGGCHGWAACWRMCRDASALYLLAISRLSISDQICQFVVPTHSDRGSFFLIRLGQNRPDPTEPIVVPRWKVGFLDPTSAKSTRPDQAQGSTASEGRIRRDANPNTDTRARRARAATTAP